jgi:hypothetical protein
MKKLTALLAGSLLLTAAPACRRPAREPLVTYYSGDHGLSLRHPSSWKTEQAEQDGVWYRYFLAPPAGPKNKAAVSVTLLVGRLGGSVDDYAQTYLAGNTLASSREESRGAAQGKAYVFSSADGATRHSLLLLKLADKVYGLYAQGEAPLFEKHSPMLDEMARSLTFENPAQYPEHKNERFGYALRVPPSWKETRSFSGGNSSLLQFRSPPLAADRDRDPVHAALTVSVEPLGSAKDVDGYYEATREKLGDAFQLLSHVKWRDGYADVMRTETQIASSRIKRFYRAGGSRGYSLACDARDDVYMKVTRWCDAIAGTFRIGEETKQP